MFLSIDNITHPLLLIRQGAPLLRRHLESTQAAGLGEMLVIGFRFERRIDAWHMFNAAPYHFGERNPPLALDSLSFVVKYIWQPYLCSFCCCAVLLLSLPHHFLVVGFSICGKGLLEHGVMLGGQGSLSIKTGVAMHGHLLPITFENAANPVRFRSVR